MPVLSLIIKMVLAERLNGVAVKNVQLNSKNERSTKCLNVYPSLGPSAPNTANQIDSNVNIKLVAFSCMYDVSLCVVYILFHTVIF